MDLVSPVVQKITIREVRRLAKWQTLRGKASRKKFNRGVRRVALNLLQGASIEPEVDLEELRRIIAEDPKE